MIKICIIVSIICIVFYALFSILENRAVKKGKIKKQKDPLKEIVKGVAENDGGTNSNSLRYDSSK